MNDDLHDPELATLLGRASGAYPDVNLAYEAVRGRVRQAKRRRVMVVSSAACALLLGGVALAAQLGGSSGAIAPSGTPTLVIETSMIQSPVTTGDDTDESVESTDASTSAPETTTAATDTTAAAVVTTTGNSGKGSSNGGSSSSSTSAPSSTSGGHTSTTEVLVPGEHTQPTDGGTVTYTFVDGVLHLVSAVPAPGWTEHVKDAEADRIRVEFTSSDDSQTWRVEIRTEGGKAPIVTSEHG